MSDIYRGEFARRYAVFHVASSQVHLDPTPQQGYSYVHVADVDAISVDDAIALTTYQWGFWPSHQAIAWVAFGVQRATSAGDLIYSYESERLWVVQSSGFIRSALSPEQLELELRSL